MTTLLRYRGYVVLTCIYAALFGGFVLYERRPQPEPMAIVTPSPTLTPTPAPALVYVTGAVRRPGVYTLSVDSRVIHAVEAAGGLADDADAEAVNLADRVTDAQRLYIPRVVTEEASAPASPPTAVAAGAGSSVAVGGVVNINTATAVELETLPGIGPAYAQRIIEYREAHGPFVGPEAIMDVSGIGPATFERIKDRITTY
ncbi:MAG TPA: ComEA family DNA-binding protein [Chloroflexi bacterium]|jgi:competence protein ComEA|nr:ComEA family DNA-binding protein [Chloroflexota bacterium]